MREIRRRVDGSVWEGGESRRSAIFAEICGGFLELVCLNSLTKMPVARIPLERAPVLTAESERLSTPAAITRLAVLGSAAA